MLSIETAQTRPGLAGWLGGRSVNVGDGERAASALGGAALVLYGLSRRTPLGLGLALLGGGLLYRGMSGHCDVYGALGASTAGTERGGGITVERAVTIERSATDLYHYWRNFENLPCFMRHLESVKPLDEIRSRWAARAPLGGAVEWEAEIVEEHEGRLISWRSVVGAQVDNAGTVRFTEAPGGRGTEVHVKLVYSPPGGLLGAAVAKLFGEEPGQQVADDLRRFKQMMEAGEVATVDGQPSGRARPGIRAALKGLAQPAARERPAPGERDADAVPWVHASEEPAWRRTAAPAPGDPKKPVQPTKPIVQKTSEDSFPASDPPSWTSSGDEAEREVGA